MISYRQLSIRENQITFPGSVSIKFVKSNNKKIERTEGIKNAKHTLLYSTTADKHETTTILSLELDIILSRLLKPKITAGCSRGFFLVIIIEGKAHS